MGKGGNFRDYQCLLFLLGCTVMFHCPKPQFPIINNVFPETGAGDGEEGRDCSW